MQAPGSSQEAILSARAVADAPFSALAARVDKFGHGDINYNEVGLEVGGR